MANKAKPRDDRDRRAKVEALRREQQAKERRKSLMFIGLAIVVGVGLVAAAAVPSLLKSRNDPAKKALSSFGAAAGAASCSAVTNDKVVGQADHKPDGTIVKYAEVPPSSGAHWASPIVPAREFYTSRDRPQMEKLVHNLEHGYTIVWYDSTIKGSQLKALKDIADRARTEKAAGPGNKFLVSSWDPAYGAFPTGKHVAISHWGAKAGHRQLCGQVSGAAVGSFITKFPYTDAPEPNAA